MQVSRSNIQKGMITSAQSDRMLCRQQSSRFSRSLANYSILKICQTPEANLRQPMIFQLFVKEPETFKG
jgi:hypothetical protein